MFTIRNSNNGLTSEDVKTCNNIEQVHVWLIEQEVDVVNMQIQRDNAEQYFNDTGEYKDKNNFKALNTALKLQSTLLSILEKRYIFLQQVNNRIVEIVEHNMEEEEWKKLREEALKGW